ncbi:uncharacterized protein BDZ99DRAFT_520989 [Mytilinidion resinicola]|uniref:Shugoshin n=1 Tax=Mytilinidion resinicola TaxID=574789 RepID=A0A6A6YNR1_9PEZI|nr:uncharacterized protein BDZ99DRAFT_520989 [Mytilinidion resinicola]KAF2809654.1 hypothetical protein BDZ99DRAFT_520989 [Mytilinidion resinicola]
MARLNEAPQSTETVDALKRRFLRQNRELAKTNSTQSVRIRNLENEGSRLLAENLSLREQVINLQTALDNQSDGPSAENIYAVRDKLEAKIHELGTLVAELGQIQNPERQRRCKSQTAATRRSPDERNWRSGAGFRQFEGDDGKLPTITEDKHYPRKTMSADQLRGMLEDPDSQSPDIGPPPVARFDTEEPIQFDPRPSASHHMVDNGSDDLNPGQNVMLETRRKRRESNPKLTIRRMSVYQSSPEGGEEGASSNEKNGGLKVGAKRKLSVREEDDAHEVAETTPDSFQYTRRGTSGVSDKDTEMDPSNDSHPLSAPERKILGSKPVNTDPILSPKKPKPTPSEKPDAKKPSKPSSRSQRLPNRRPRFEPVEVAPIQTEPVEEPVEFLPPKTPATDNMFSPPTNPSTQRPETRDTPPPADLNPSGTSNDANGLAGRAARRARPQVNYAEPNLISKMRRPTKELADAVGPKPEDRRSMSAEPATSDRSKLRDVVVKREKEEGSDSAWKRLQKPNEAERDEVGEKDSPLSKKAGRQMAQAGQQGGNDLVPPTQYPSATAHAISKLVSATANSRRKSVQIAEADRGPERIDRSQEHPQEKDMAKDKDGLAIYDFTDSSPTDAPTTGRSRIDLAKQTKTSRRHSSVPASGTLPSILKQPSTSRSSSSSNLAGKSVDERKSSSTMKRSSNTTSSGVASGDESAGVSGREGRAAGRRRSMMM